MGWAHQSGAEASLTPGSLRELYRTFANEHRAAMSVPDPEEESATRGPLLEPCSVCLMVASDGLGQPALAVEFF